MNDTSEQVFISESAVNATENHGIYYNERLAVEDSIFYGVPTAGELYRHCVREHGRCTGKVYVDTPDGVLHVGYVFQARREYDDTAETYLHETWVTLETIERREDIVRPVALGSKVQS